MSQYYPAFDLKINVDHHDLYFMVRAVISRNILKTIFRGPVILCYILNNI